MIRDIHSQLGRVLDMARPPVRGADHVDVGCLVVSEKAVHIYVGCV
jgi:hypothetical protein